MIVNADVKSLEIVVAAQLSNDKTLMNEIVQQLDTHTDNQNRFNLPDRITAKRFIFKLLYGATAFGYANDSDFISLNYSDKKWQGVIDEFYCKYTGIAKWHKQLINEAQTTGRLLIPSGRYYPITPDFTKRSPWPLTVIKNYPVQGFGADLVMLARLRAKQLLRETDVEAKLISTVHDSIVVDTPKESCYNISMLLQKAIEDVPRLVKEIWNYNFVLPLSCEVKVGMNGRDLEKIKLD